jgi:hypothetical protein
MTDPQRVTARLLRDGEDMGAVTLTLDRSPRSSRADWTGDLAPADPKVKMGLVLQPVGRENTAFEFALAGRDPDRLWPISFVSADEVQNTGQVQGLGLPPS